MRRLDRRGLRLRVDPPLLLFLLLIQFRRNVIELDHTPISGFKNIDQTLWSTTLAITVDVFSWK